MEKAYWGGKEGVLGRGHGHGGREWDTVEKCQYHGELSTGRGRGLRDEVGQGQK